METGYAIAFIINGIIIALLVILLSRSHKRVYQCFSLIDEGQAQIKKTQAVAKDSLA